MKEAGGRVRFCKHSRKWVCDGQRPPDPESLSPSKRTTSAGIPQCPSVRAVFELDINRRPPKVPTTLLRAPRSVPPLPLSLQRRSGPPDCLPHIDGASCLGIFRLFPVLFPLQILLLERSSSSLPVTSVLVLRASRSGRAESWGVHAFKGPGSCRLISGCL